MTTEYKTVQVWNQRTGKIEIVPVSDQRFTPPQKREGYGSHNRGSSRTGRVPRRTIPQGET
jgi:hypothetical protein